MLVVLTGLPGTGKSAFFGPRSPPYAVSSRTETWVRLSLVKGSRFQSLHRSREVIARARWLLPEAMR